MEKKPIGEKLFFMIKIKNFYHKKQLPSDRLFSMSNSVNKKST